MRPVDLIHIGGGDAVILGGEELDADIVERDGAVAHIGDDDADGHQAVLQVIQPEEVCAVFGIKGVGGDADALVRMRIHIGVCRGRTGIGRTPGSPRDRAECKRYQQKCKASLHRCTIILCAVGRSKARKGSRTIWILYSFALLLALVLGSPFWLLRMLTAGKYRAGLAGLGAVPPALREYARGRRTIWLHAVSVGEIIAAGHLIAELEDALPGHRICISTTTLTGHTLAQQRFGSERVFYFPLDFAFIVRRYLRALAPELVVLVETEFWPNLLLQCARRNVPVAVVNARISDRSLPRYRRLRGLWRPVADEDRALLRSE